MGKSILYKDRNPEQKARMAAASRRWREGHREQWRASRRKHYASRREHLLALQKWYAKRGRQQNPERRWERTLRENYGLTSSAYWEMFKAQAGVCAICREPARAGRLAVDHDHLTGSVRGLLCNSCNKMLGWARDEPKTLQLAAAYLSERNNPLRLVEEEANIGG